MNSRPNAFRKNQTTLQSVLPLARAKRQIFVGDEYMSSIVSVASELSHDALVDFACIDLIERIETGAEATSEQYTGAFAVLRTNERELELIDAEICALQSAGLEPIEQQFVSRFPHLAPEIAGMFQLSRLEQKLEQAPSSPNQLPASQQFADWNIRSVPDQINCFFATVQPNKEDGDSKVLAKEDRTAGGQNYILQRAELPVRSLSKYEYELAGRLVGLEQRNLVRIIEIGYSSDFVYQVFEKIEGSRLSEVTKIIADLEQVKGLARKLVFGLLAAKQAGVHSVQLKPDRIWLDHSGVVKILLVDIADWRSTEHSKAMLGLQNCMRLEVQRFGLLLSELLQQAELHADQELSAWIEGCCADTSMNRIKKRPYAIATLDELADFMTR